jgi:hypothetical protein
LETSPSLTPNTTARNQPAARALPLGEPSNHQGVHPLVGCHRRGRVRLGVVVAAGLGALDQRQHQQRPKPTGQPAQQPRPRPESAWCLLGRLQPFRPMCRVALLGASQRQQDLSFLTVAPPRQGAVDRGGVLLLRQAPPIPRAARHSGSLLPQRRAANPCGRSMADTGHGGLATAATFTSSARS